MALTFRLDGKVALITGSTRGIGWASAKALAEAGAAVVLNGSHDADVLQQRTEALKNEFDTPCIGLFGSVSDPASVKQCYRTIFDRFKRLDILVNNAGVLSDALLGMISSEMIEQVVSTNLLGCIYHLQEASRLMGRNKSGSIINVSSMIGRVGNEGQAVYGASKAGVIGLTLSASKELAPKNIRVNAVAPGLIETDMTKALPEQKYHERLRSIKMGRIGQPEDIANAILFLASDLSAYITGQVLGVDGGMLI
jgi:3-oxoacyl-[acyl-carrier protein] reductase